jgi:hypothetical protein
LNLKPKGTKIILRVISKYSSIDMGEGKGVGKCAKVLNKMWRKSKSSVLFLKNKERGVIKYF